MTLLQDIQTAAIDANTTIGTLLRKCVLLASRLDNRELAEWAGHELQGYPTSVEPPEYRTIAAPASGNLAGPFGSGYKGITIPPSLLPENLRRFATHRVLHEPVATIEALASGTKGDVLTVMWPGDLVALLAEGKFASGLVLYGAWQTVSKSSLIGILDTIRNRVLDFALQLEKAAPSAGEAGPTTNVPPNVVNNLYQTIINAPVTGNVATGGTVSQAIDNRVVAKGDWQSLADALRTSGLSDADVQDLRTAIDEDPPADELAKKPKTSSWLVRLMQKSTAGTSKLASGVTIQVIGRLIAQYLGIPQ